MTGEQVTFIIVVIAAVVAFAIYRFTKQAAPPVRRDNDRYKKPGEVFLAPARLEAVNITYKDRSGAVTTRNIRAQAIVMTPVSGGHLVATKVVAYCDTVQARRTFRLDRIATAYVIADQRRINPIEFFRASSDAVALPDALFSLRDRAPQEPAEEA